MKSKVLRQAFVLLILPLGSAFLPGAESNAEALPSPLTLPRALDYALRNNPTLNRVREQLREQEGGLLTAKAGMLPQLSVGAQQTRTERELLSTPGGTQDAWQVQAGVTQVLYAGGALKAGSSAQRAQVEAARCAVEAQAAESVLQVRQAFYQVLLNRELVVVQEEELAVLEKELVDTRSRRDVGSASDFELLRAEVAVANARPLLIRARNSHRTSIDRLRQLLGAPAVAPREPATAVEGSLEPSGGVPELSEALRTAREARPELRRQIQLQKAGVQGVEAAKAGYRPTVSAFGNYTWVSSPLSADWNRRLDGGVLGVQANINLFDGRRTAGKVRQARSQARQLDHGYEELVLAVDYEVRSAHAALQEAEEVLRSAELTVAQAKESLRLALARHQSGTATQLDVLSAQSALTQARSSQSQARFSHLTATALLERATGKPLPGS